jgi:DNA-directed RNA polymerase subunit RPC12/RpoP
MMEAREYLKKASGICNDYGCNRCKDCPIRKLNCGLPESEEDIEDAVNLVERYEEEKYPFGRCPNCKKEFNSELISEYEISHCPWCGAKLNDNLEEEAQ